MYVVDIILEELSTGACSHIFYLALNLSPEQYFHQFAGDGQKHCCNNSIQFFIIYVPSQQP
jgi:hypothetical protein